MIFLLFGRCFLLLNYYGDNLLENLNSAKRTKCTQNSYNFFRYYTIQDDSEETELRVLLDRGDKPSTIHRIRAPSHTSGKWEVGRAQVGHIDGDFKLRLSGEKVQPHHFIAVDDVSYNGCGQPPPQKICEIGSIQCPNTGRRN